MSAYLASEWSDFGVAVVGAAAALSGLLFVAVSINIKRILSYATLPARAAQTLILFSSPLVLGVCLLIPEQPALALGIELIGTGVLVGGVLMMLNRPANRAAQETRANWLLGRMGPAVAIGALVVVSGITVIIGSGGGLYWIPAAVLIALIAGLGNAWVLLVEILR